MRYYFTLLLFFALQLTYAQCCPYVQPVQVLPANPSPTDNVRLVFQAITPNLGNRVSTNFVRSGNSLTFTGCYYSGLLTSLQGFSDTVSVGQLPLGSYSISFVAVMSSNSQQCVEQRSNSSTRTFQVSNALATRSPVAGWAIYPIPTASRHLLLTAPTNESLKSLELLDVAGRVCFASPAAQLTPSAGQLKLALPQLPAGTYTLKAHLISGGLVTHRVILQ